MAEPETAASSPSSATGLGNAPKAPKDRSCPFCGQAFTSSSLGRHLDLYIKPKNPKPPDGVHDVDEIRKIRGGITRRQPRSSLKSAGAAPAVSVRSAGGDGNAARAESEGKTGGTPAAPPNAVRKDFEESPVESPSGHKATKAPAFTLNRANWLATGVINDLPPRSASRNAADEPASDQAQRMQEMRRDTGGNRIQRPEYDGDNNIFKLHEAAELGRAAEMALREVLGSIEAADRKENPGKLFPDFDFFSLPFPGLCLALLPAPSTLFSPIPFPSTDSWSLGPPGQRQYDALNRVIHQHIVAVVEQHKIPDSVVFKHHAHLSAAWEHWQTMSDSDRASAWNLEILRSLSRTQEQNRTLQSELESSKQRTLHLEAEYERLSKCQLPREYLMHPPNTTPIQPAVMRQARSALKRSEAAEVDFDADALIQKWRSTIKAATRPSRALPPQPAATTYNEPRPHDIREEMVMTGSIWTVGGPMPRDPAETDPESLHTQPANVSYETPPEPGTVTNVDDGEGSLSAGGYEPGNADDEHQDGRSSSSAATPTYQGMLMRLNNVKNRLSGSGSYDRTDNYSSNARGSINANGKRPLASFAANGRVTKAYGSPTSADRGRS